MSDARLIEITLDSESILWRSAEIEQERRIAIHDILESNVFVPAKHHDDGYAGPYRLALKIADGRLALALAREDGAPLNSIILAMGRFRRLIRDYFAICDSYYDAIRLSTPQQIETIDMARRAIHNEAAILLKDRLDGKVDIDFDTARRLFTLISVLHIKV